MANFMIRFLICNVFISGIIGILLIAKRIFKNNLSSRMQYNLWFLLLGLLAVPFIPFRLIGFPQIFSWLGSLRSSPASGTPTAMGEAVGIHPVGNTDWMNDFALSVNSETPSIAGYILLGIWIIGIFAMIILVIKSSLRLRNLEKSGLPLQNPEVRSLYHRCLPGKGAGGKIVYPAWNVCDDVSTADCRTDHQLFGGPYGFMQQNRYFRTV